MNSATLTCRQCGQIVAISSSAFSLSGDKTCPGCGSSLRPFESETLIVPAAGTRESGDRIVEVPGYQILGQIGRGGMGIVFAARQLSLSRIVAVKIIPPELSRNADFLARFEREASSLAKLSHPNIVAIYERGRVGDNHYIIMEYVEGAGEGPPQDLRLLARQSGVSFEEIKRLGLQIGSALAHAHSMGIIHRDVKPSNVLIDRRGHAKLTDFGIAAVLEPNARHLTQDKSSMGTPHYMAPEQQLDASQVDGRADVYSLGVMLYELLTGSLPFGAFDSPSKIVKCPRGWDDLVLRALRPQRDQRWATMDEMVRAIESVDRVEFPAVAGGSRMNDSSPSSSRSEAVAEVERCGVCSGRADRSEQFCRQCGAELWTACPACSTSAWATDAFCPNCGIDLQKRIQLQKLLVLAEQELDAIEKIDDVTIRIQHAEQACIALAKALRSDPEAESVRIRLQESNHILAGLLLNEGNLAYSEKRLYTALTYFERLSELGALDSRTERRIEKIRTLRQDVLARAHDALRVGDARGARDVLNGAKSAFADDPEFEAIRDDATTRLTAVKSSIQDVPQLLKDRRLFAARQLLNQLNSSGVAISGLKQSIQDVERRVAQCDSWLREAESRLSAADYGTASRLLNQVVYEAVDHPFARQTLDVVRQKQALLNERLEKFGSAFRDGRWFRAVGELEPVLPLELDHARAGSFVAAAIANIRMANAYLKLLAFAAVAGALILLSGKIAYWLFKGIEAFVPEASRSTDAIVPLLAQIATQLLVQPLIALAMLWAAAWSISKSSRSPRTVVHTLLLVAAPVGVAAALLAIDRLMFKVGQGDDGPILEVLRSYGKPAGHAVIFVVFWWCSSAAYAILTGSAIGLRFRSLPLNTFVCGAAMYGLLLATAYAPEYSSRLAAAWIACGLIAVFFPGASMWRFVFISTAWGLDSLIRFGAERSEAAWYASFDWITASVLLVAAASGSVRPFNRKTAVVVLATAAFGTICEGWVAHVAAIPPLAFLACAWSLTMGAVAAAGNADLERRFHLLDRWWRHRRRSTLKHDTSETPPMVAIVEP